MRSADVEHIDVEAVLAFAEKLVKHPRQLWLESTLEQKQRLQRVFFPDGVKYTKDGFGTAVSNSFFSVLRDLSEKKQLWRPRRDSNPRYRRERAMS